MVPDYQTLMLPVLKAAATQERKTRDVMAEIADEFELSQEDREEILDSGNQRRLDNRVNWAKTYLKQAGLVRYTRKAHYIATEEGQEALRQQPDRIDTAFLRRYPAFQEFRNRKSVASNSSNSPDVSATEREIETPDETLRAAHKQINDALSVDLIDRVREATPQFFEELIVGLLLAMGYGGTSEDAARALGGSGDNGIDGVVDQDPLGVDQIYIQAKRYGAGNTVGSGDIRDFFGALNLKKAHKGIFFTTSAFTKAATQTARDLGMRIVLIDGPQLAKLMMRYNVGCRDEEVLHLKRVDEEFFEG
ncbi:MAG: restriction endonuclease [Methylophaga sp.]|uniref:restriction endonuclease n=1 Tax=Methylophaga sp. TaxID=2024840 RepID=UPI00216E7775|nr:restriction endonuclease [Methylophaga sp.]MBL1459087.1 restriction endonuclease [Methylophaga sp.]